MKMAEDIIKEVILEELHVEQKSAALAAKKITQRLCLDKTEVIDLKKIKSSRYIPEKLSEKEDGLLSASIEAQIQIQNMLKPIDELRKVIK